MPKNIIKVAKKLLGVLWQDELGVKKKSSRKNVNILERKCLFVQSVCTNYGLFVQSICTNKSLIVQSLIYFFSSCKLSQLLQ